MKFFRLILLLCIATALFGCALSPKNKDAAKSSDALLQSQLTSIENFASKLAPTEKLFVYVGSAQHSQSLAFQNDVLLGEAFFSKIEPKFKSIILSNEQKNILDEAMELALKKEDCIDEINQNKNGNVLSAILRHYVGC